ncbi:MAG: universal stress protein [Dongiaceae bacterium]
MAVIKDILVHIDSGKSSAGRIDAAIGLAESFDAHVTGLLLSLEPMAPIAVPGLVPVVLPEFVYDEAAKAAEAVAAAFRETVTKAGLSADCRTVTVLSMDAAETVALHARHSDLVVLGQTSPDEIVPGGPSFCSDVIMAAGRPALIVPYIGARARLGERILVAWNASRESARAVNDSLPFLVKAKAVTVLTVNPDKNGMESRREPGADIALHLARHGVKVEAERAVARDISVGDAILAEIGDNGQDMLVMGAYGHSRLQEFVLGGVTRKLLQVMTVPVLMSH